MAGDTLTITVAFVAGGSGTALVLNVRRILLKASQLLEARIDQGLADLGGRLETIDGHVKTIDHAVNQVAPGESRLIEQVGEIRERVNDLAADVSHLRDALAERAVDHSADVDALLIQIERLKREVDLMRIDRVRRAPRDIDLRDRGDPT